MYDQDIAAIKEMVDSLARAITQSSAQLSEALKYYADAVRTHPKPQEDLNKKD